MRFNCVARPGGFREAGHAKAGHNRSNPMITICKLYQGDSCRVDNGSQIDLPIFGRYAAIVREDWLAVCETNDGEWYVRLPMGSSMFGEWTQDEAIEHAQAIQAAGYQGWIADREAAASLAIADAKERHNAKARESAAYAAKFGAAL
jgi:hypothetical protein